MTLISKSGNKNMWWIAISCWSGMPQTFKRIQLYCHCPTWEDLMAGDTATLAAENFKLTGKFPPSLLASFHHAKRCFLGFWERNNISCLIQRWTLHATILTSQARRSQWWNIAVNVMGWLLSVWIWDICSTGGNSVPHTVIP